MLGEIHQASIKKLSNKEDIRKSSKKSRNKRNNKAKGNQTHDLTVLYTNADQFSNKKDQLLLFIDNKQPDIIMITEMLPKNQINEIPPTIWNINGYTQYLNFNTDDENPNLTDIRGTAIYIKREIITSEVKINESSYKDLLWVETHLEGNEKILIGCIYRSPTAEKEETIKSLKCIEQMY